MKDILNKLAIMPDDEELYNDIIRHENPNKEGYNPETKTWTPHISPEGGTDTIAVGSKILKEKFTPEQIYEFYNKGISDEEASHLLKSDINSAKVATQRIIDEKKLHYLNPTQRNALTQMVFQMGATGVRQFPKMMEALQRKDVKGAYKEALDSKWATHDSPERAKEVAEKLLGQPPARSPATPTYAPMQQQLEEFNKYRNRSQEELNQINKLPSIKLQDAALSTLNETDDQGKEEVKKRIIDLSRLA